MTCLPSPSVFCVPLQFPDETVLHRAACHYREARLRALLTDSEVFASSYEKEVRFPLDVWTGRLQNKQAKTFMIVPHYGGNDVFSAVDQAWLGSLTLLGPRAQNIPGISAKETPWTTFSRPHDLDAPPLLELEYLLTGMFVLPEVRGRGFGKRLLQRAQDTAISEAKALHAKHVRFSVLVDTDNPAALHLYETSGFSIDKEEEFTNQKGETKNAYLLEHEIEIPSQDIKTD